jgi:hypothetical protein
MYLVARIENVTRFGHANDNGMSSRHCDGIKSPCSLLLHCAMSCQRRVTSTSALFALFDVTVCFAIHFLYSGGAPIEAN